jgi:hypothetical protein
MWIVTSQHWPTLVNLENVAHIRYQQISKADPRIRIMAVTCEGEIVLAEAVDGERARALVRLIAEAITDGQDLLDLTEIDPNDLR